MKLLHSILFSSLLVVSVYSNAASYPTPIANDSRVLEVDYLPYDVVEISSSPGVLTQIVLEKNEKYEAHEFGDPKAWHFNHFKNNMFFKPAERLGTTNLVLITNKRQYLFKVNYNEGKNDVYKVVFRYHLDKKSDVTDEKRIEEKLANASKEKVYNLDYAMRGDTSIAPLFAYDDDTFTYFEFPGNVDLPAIYAVVGDKNSAYGKELIVNKTIKGEGNQIIVMHKVNAMWRFRLGDSVLEVMNKNPKWWGTTNKTGTVSEAVKRKGKE